MEAIEQWLDSEDILTKVYVFQLARGDKKTFIYVHEVISGPSRNAFLAEPTVLLGTTKDEYIGRGSSVEEALADCLRRIKGCSVDEISGLIRE